MSENQERQVEPISARMRVRGLTLDSLSERTKVPRSTIRALLGDEGPAVLPERVYLRGHLKVIARELDLDPGELLARFDVDHPLPPRTDDILAQRRFGRGSVALVATLGGVAILAVVLAFFSAVS